MPKEGLLHDYDLHASLEKSSIGVKCAVCDTENISFQWSDYSGEAMCRVCGCPYQLKWGSEEQQRERKYPYLNVDPEWLPILREYWNERHTWTCFGTMLGKVPGIRDFNQWVQKIHPEMLKKEETKNEQTKKDPIN